VDLPDSEEIELEHESEHFPDCPHSPSFDLLTCPEYLERLCLPLSYCEADRGCWKGCTCTQQSDAIMQTMDEIAEQTDADLVWPGRGREPYELE